MLAALLLSLGLQTAPDALEQERCLRALDALDARVNRSARIDWRYLDEVQKITAVRQHRHNHGPWPPGVDLLGIGVAGVTAEQAAEIRREAGTAGLADLSRRLDQCLVRYPITADED